MTQTLAISTLVKSLRDLREKFQLIPSRDPNFFREWCEQLPELTEVEVEALDRLKERFLAHFERGELAEGTIDKLIVSPLLDLAGLFEPRFVLDTEVSVSIEVKDRVGEDEEEVYRGRIDTLIFQHQLWVLLIEQKRTAVAIAGAIPQLFAYMLAHSDSETVFGLIASGNEFIFAKIVKGGSPQYAFSRSFTLFPVQNELYEVLRILKRFANLI